MVLYNYRLRLAANFRSALDCLMEWQGWSDRRRWLEGRTHGRTDVPRDARGDGCVTVCSLLDRLAAGVMDAAGCADGRLVARTVGGGGDV